MNFFRSAMFRRFVALFLLTVGCVCAQTATDTNLGSKLTVDSSTVPATYTFSWWGTTGYHYLVQNSSDLLLPWSFLPNFNPSGTDAVLSVQFATNANKYFFRTIQFDPNDVPSGMDTDGDGLPDQWELYYFGNLSRDGNGDWNNDGILDRDAFRFGLDPTAPAAVVPGDGPIDPLAPQVILVPSVEYTGDSTATLNGKVTPAEGATLAGLWLNNQPFTPLQAGDLASTVFLAEGVNSFTLKATDNLGHSRSVTVRVTRDTALPSLMIISPIAGATIAATSINVAGRVSGATPLKSLTVNGVSAYVIAGTYEASAVPLTVGTNVLTVTATDILGKVRTITKNVTALLPVADPVTGIVPDPVTVVATPVEGSAPIQVRLTVVSNAPGTFHQVIYDFEGTHKNTVAATTLAPVDHIYTLAGNYYPVVTVRTSAGSFTNKTGPTVPVAQRLTIPVAGEDSPLAVWAAMKQCLLAQDINGAAEYMNSERKAGFIAMMADLGSDGAVKMANDFGTLSLEQTYDDVAQYNAAVLTPIGLVAFPVSFIRENGKWRVDSF
jgi:hypothetical protein